MAQLLAAIGAAWFAYGQVIEMKNQLAEIRRTSAVQAETLLRQYFSEIETHKQTLDNSRRELWSLTTLGDLEDVTITKPEDFGAQRRQASEVLSKIAAELVRPTPSVTTADTRSKCNDDFFDITVKLDNKLFTVIRDRNLTHEAFAAAKKDARDYYDANFNHVADSCLLALDARQRVLSDQINKIDAMVIQQ